MLVLTRKTDERIRIGDGISVTVIDIRGGKVRLGIDAPPEMGIWRQELVDECPELQNAAADRRHDGRPTNDDAKAPTGGDTTAAGSPPATPS